MLGWLPQPFLIQRSKRVAPPETIEAITQTRRQQGKRAAPANRCRQLPEPMVAVWVDA
jgi:hypothetical protein